MSAEAPLKEIYPVIARVKKGAHLNTPAEYKKLYKESVKNPDKFWGGMAKKFLTWQRPFERVLAGDFAEGNIAWFAGGRMNVSENCLDRHLAKRGDQVAILWEGDEPGDVRRVTYKQLHAEVTAGFRLCIVEANPPPIVTVNSVAANTQPNFNAS